MAYVYKVNHVAKSKWNIKCPYTMDAEWITIHNTANRVEASREISYHNTNKNAVSYHIAIDDKEAIECVPLTRNAFHCGDGSKGTGNRKSIGIEICYSTLGGKKYEDSEENAVHLVAKMLHERGWGVERVVPHKKWSSKNCPHRILSEGRWDSFVKRIDIQLKKLQNPTKGKVDKHKEEPKDYSKSIGIKKDEESKVYRLHTNAYSNKQDAEKAIKDLVGKYLSYAEVFGNEKEGYRLQSGKYTTLEDAENAAKKLIDDKKRNYISIIGAKA